MFIKVRKRKSKRWGFPMLESESYSQTQQTPNPAAQDPELVPPDEKEFMTTHSLFSVF